MASWRRSISGLPSCRRLQCFVDARWNGHAVSRCRHMVTYVRTLEAKKRHAMCLKVDDGGESIP